MKTAFREFLGKLAYDTYCADPGKRTRTGPEWGTLAPEVQERWRCAAQDVEVIVANNGPYQDYIPSWLNVDDDTAARWKGATQAVESTTPDMDAPAQGLQ